MAHDPLDPGHLIDHVKDSHYFELPRRLGGKIHLPQVVDAKPATNAFIEPLDFQLTKYMVLEVVAAVILVLLLVPLAAKIKSGQAVRGRFWNALEAVLLFVRDEIARPAIGKKDADRFLPFLWTIFFFVLACNLLGMLPWMGSPTGAMGTTSTLALMTFGMVVWAGSKQMGFVGFMKAQVPHIDVPPALGVLLKPMIFIIEVVGLGIKHFVLAVRLLANMFAGHLVLGVIVAFVAAIWLHPSVTTVTHPLFLGVSGASILGAVAISMLELFVAFLQAYVFTFLSALFIGTAVHPH